MVKLILFINERTAREGFLPPLPSCLQFLINALAISLTPSGLIAPLMNSSGVSLAGSSRFATPEPAKL